MSSRKGEPSLPPPDMMGRFVSNAVRSPLFFLLTALFGSVSLALSLLDKDGRRQHAVARLWAKTILKVAGASVSVTGRENILPLAIYTSNHASFMDTPLVFSSLPQQFRILAKQSLWKWPFIGWHLQRSGQIPIDEETGSGTLTGLNRAIRALKSGTSLFIFPEGGRTEDGALQEFMKGPAYIAIRSRVPLVPIALVGTYELLPMHSHHFRPGPLKLVFGLPIDPAGYTIRQADELTQRLRREILELYHQNCRQPAPSDAAAAAPLLIDKPGLANEE